MNRRDAPGQSGLPPFGVETPGQDGQRDRYQGIDEFQGTRPNATLRYEYTLTPCNRLLCLGEFDSHRFQLTTRGAS